MNELTLDLSDKEIASAFAGNKVGDECTLENVNLKVKRISMSHDDEYDPKTGTKTGKKKVRGTIDLEVDSFDYGDSSYDLGGDKKEKANITEKAPQPAYPSEGSSLAVGSKKSKPAVAVTIGLGKRK